MLDIKRQALDTQTPDTKSQTLNTQRQTIDARHKETGARHKMRYLCLPAGREVTGGGRGHCHSVVRFRRKLVFQFDNELPPGLLFVNMLHPITPNKHVTLSYDTNKHMCQLTGIYLVSRLS